MYGGLIMRKSIKLLVFLIIVLSFIASTCGIFSNQGQGQGQFISIYGETISIYGKGLYQHDSVSMASQAIAQDYITLFMGLPLLILSLFLSKQGSIKGKLLLTGTLGYFLYTYASYSFLSMYNSLFLIDIIIMSASFFAFILAMMSFDIQNSSSYFTEKLPVKFIGSFLLLTSFVFGMMWVGKIMPSLMNHTPPTGLEHYTTLVIQAMDLGFLVPTGILAGILVIKRRPFGYLLSSVIIIKDITLVSALTAMIFLQISAGINVSNYVLVVVILINILVIYCMILIMKNVQEPVKTGR